MSRFLSTSLEHFFYLVRDYIVHNTRILVIGVSFAFQFILHSFIRLLNQTSWEESIMAKEVSFSSLDEATQQLIRTSLVARENAYCPYSKFKVGCSLLCTDGTVITGCNVENASYGLTICAERNALTTAVAQGKIRFKTLAVSGVLPGKTFLPPCGACRQFICEFGSEIEVYMVRAEPDLDQETVMHTTSGQLLPLGVNLERLGDTIVVSADLGEGESFLPPCGICRQFLCEFGTDIVVYLVKPSLETVMVTTSGYLLPLSSNLSRLRDIHKK
ncbi:hypothetical protein B566_EDAN003543 [Ephemera danica]|nr:hypothetical protein B566_EDAN003543 [Ephemera danica]